MASVGGRISSARLLTSAKSHRIIRANGVKKDKTVLNNTVTVKNLDKSKIKIDKIVLESVDEEQLNVQETKPDKINNDSEKKEVEENFFLVLTPEKL